MTYKNLKTRDRFYNRALRRNLHEIPFIFPEYEDALIVVFDFYPISVFWLLKMSYWEMIDAYECWKTSCKCRKQWMKHQKKHQYKAASSVGN